MQTLKRREKQTNKNRKNKVKELKIPVPALTSEGKETCISRSVFCDSGTSHTLFTDQNFVVEHGNTILTKNPHSYAMLEYNFHQV